MANESGVRFSSRALPSTVDSTKKLSNSLNDKRVSKCRSKTLTASDLTSPNCAVLVLNQFPSPQMENVCIAFSL